MRRDFKGVINQHQLMHKGLLISIINQGKPTILGLNGGFTFLASNASQSISRKNECARIASSLNEQEIFEVKLINKISATSPGIPCSQAGAAGSSS
jgi:hypothetical protein